MQFTLFYPFVYLQCLFGPNIEDCVSNLAIVLQYLGDHILRVGNIPPVFLLSYQIFVMTKHSQLKPSYFHRPNIALFWWGMLLLSDLLLLIMTSFFISGRLFIIWDISRENHTCRPGLWNWSDRLRKICPDFPAYKCQSPYLKVAIFTKSHLMSKYMLVFVC